MAAYPDIEIPKETMAVWIERLRTAPFEPSLNNLNKHIDSSNYFPRIASVIGSVTDQTNHVQLSSHTEDRYSEMGEWEQNAIDCPPQLRRFGSDATE
jgi:hypothetical protein